GAEPYTAADRALDLPAIVGIGGSLIYFTDRYGDGTTPYDTEFEWLAAPKLAGVGFHYLDHLTHNVHRGNMDTGLRCSRTCRSTRQRPARRRGGRSCRVSPTPQPHRRCHRAMLTPCKTAARAG
ncbi:MAG: hypothetical protein INF52_09970, partial [Rhodobacter sp.]|nr:hypothetical protein [Rhodobacter sp.]